MALADDANRYIDGAKPWVVIKEKGREAEVHATCTQGINLFRVLMAYLAPVMPFTADRAAEFLGSPVADWQSIDVPLLGTSLNAFQPLLMRIDPIKVSAMVEDWQNVVKGKQHRSDALQEQPKKRAPARTANKDHAGDNLNEHPRQGAG